MKTRPLILLLLVFYVFSPTLFDWMINPTGVWYNNATLWSLGLNTVSFVLVFWLIRATYDERYKCTTDEISHPVGSTLDGVHSAADTKSRLNERLHSERLASIGRLAAGVAHEIGNPITGIACLAQNIRYETQDPELLEAAEQILFQTDRVDRIVQSLVSFSHAGSHRSDEFEPVALRNCAEEAIHLLSLQKDKTNVVFVNDLPPEVTIEGDSQRMIQVFLNLLSNARDASLPGGRVVVAAEEDGQSLLITVTDEGEGIDPRQIDRILEPFFTTKEPGKGTGLGLSMVYSIVTEHRGQIEVTSPVANERGARFTLKFNRQSQS